MQNRVLVLDRNRQPLMPCHPARTRELLRDGKAALPLQLNARAEALNSDGSSTHRRLPRKPSGASSGGKGRRGPE
ncbi:RRXRR domain-containing protein [Thiomonas sp.]